jgi:FkbM family methyltransferase
MLINLHDLCHKYNLRIDGVLHVGAHRCEEQEVYDQCHAGEVIWIEANPSLCEEMQQKYKNVYQAVISDKDGEEVDFIITNNYQSSSILDLHEHKKEHPDVYEIDRIKLKTVRLNTFLKSINAPKFNFMNLDIQGVELYALKGMDEFLDNVQYIYTEVNTKELYKNNPLMSDIDEYLATKGFERKETNMTSHGWGDAFYIKA